jgi:hypothetical protein
MFHDDAIEEMRERRRKLLKEKYDGSLECLFNDAEQWQKQHPERIVQPQRANDLKTAL